MNSKLNIGYRVGGLQKFIWSILGLTSLTGIPGSATALIV